MTGAELIVFIQENKLDTEEVKIEYFSWEKKEKYCNGCKSIVQLDKFHKGTAEVEPSQSSYYRYICKDCVSKARFQDRYKEQRSAKWSQKRTQREYTNPIGPRRDGRY